MEQLMPEKEVWKPVDWIDWLPNNYYAVSNLGRMRSLKRTAMSKTPAGKIFYRTVPEKTYSFNHDNNYQPFVVQYNNRRFNSWVHRFVAKAFIPNTNNYPEVNHKNTIKHNNNYDNLEWCTSSYNHKHAIKMGKWTSDYCRKPVIRIDTHKGATTEYRTIYAASLEVGLSCPTIRTRCRDGKIKNNEHWQYKQEK